MKKITFLTKYQTWSNFRLGLIVLLFVQSFTLSATDYYVNANSGDDGNNGQSAFNAFRSISRMSSVTLRPGDNVYFMNGTYTRPGSTLWNITESGTENAYITIQNYPGHRPVLEFDSWSGLNLINGASYLRFSGLQIKGPNSRINPEDALNQPASCARNFEGNPSGFYNGVGLLAVGPNLRWSDSATTGNEIPTHIIVENCEVYDCPSSGLAFQQADYITIRNNKVYNNSWYSIYGTSGINMYQFINTDNTTGVHNIVENNLMYGNQLKVPQVPFCEYYDGNALIVDDFNHVQKTNYKNANVEYPVYTARTVIANNVSVENGGSGLHFYLSSNIDIFNNTAVGNAFQNNFSNGNADLRIGDCNNINVINNILSGEKIHGISETNINFVYENNYENGPFPSAIVGGDLCSSCVFGELAFENTDINAANPYITVNGSSIVDKGQVVSGVSSDFQGNARPQGVTYDIGAYEFEANGDGVQNIAPTIALVSPNNGQTFTEGENVAIEYTANDEDGTIASVAFYINNTLVSTDNSAPYVYNVTPEVGTSSIYAIATDNSGSTATSATTTITVEQEEVIENIAPTIALVSPNNGQTFTEGENVAIEYTANDEDGTVASVAFYINNTLVSTDTSAPYVYNVTPEVGTSSIYAIATDNSGSTATSATINITVEADVIIIDDNGACDFAKPLSTPLPTISASYNNVYVIGQNGPSLDNLKRFNIKWNLNNNGLYNFSINTNNGQPAYWVNLRKGVSQSLSSENPSITISNSGFAGLDGDYFARLHENNFVLISKTGDFTIYFSNSTTAPACNSGALAKTLSSKQFSANSNDKDVVSLFPNPASDYLNIKMNYQASTQVVVYALDGRLISDTTFANDAGTSVNQIPVYNLSNGTYIVKITADNFEKPMFKYFVKK